MFLTGKSRKADLCAGVPPGGLSKLSSDPATLVNDAVEESTHLIGAMLKFAANLIAPEEDQGSGALPVHIQQILNMRTLSSLQENVNIC